MTIFNPIETSVDPTDLLTEFSETSLWHRFPNYKVHEVSWGLDQYAQPNPPIQYIVPDVDLETLPPAELFFPAVRGKALRRSNRTEPTQAIDLRDIIDLVDDLNQDNQYHDKLIKFAQTYGLLGMFHNTILSINNAWFLDAINEDDAYLYPRREITQKAGGIFLHRAQWATETKDDRGFDMTDYGYGPDEYKFKWDKFFPNDEDAFPWKSPVSLSWPPTGFIEIYRSVFDSDIVRMPIDYIAKNYMPRILDVNVMPTDYALCAGLIQRNEDALLLRTYHRLGSRAFNCLYGERPDIMIQVLSGFKALCETLTDNPDFTSRDYGTDRRVRIALMQLNHASDVKPRLFMDNEGTRRGGFGYQSLIGLLAYAVIEGLSDGDRFQRCQATKPRSTELCGKLFLARPSGKEKDPNARKWCSRECKQRMNKQSQRRNLRKL